MPNELIKSEVESVEGEHFTQAEYYRDRIKKIERDYASQIAERERIKRRHDLEMETAMVLARIKQSIALHEAMTRAEQKQQSITTYCKGFDKAMMFIFLAFAAVVLKLSGV